MLNFVIFSVFLTLSLHFSKYRIQETLKKHNLAETMIFYKENTDVIDYDLDGFEYTSGRAKNYAIDLGYQVSEVPVVSYIDLTLEAYQDDYPVLKGKKLSELEDNEIAISQEYARTLGENPLEKTLDWYGQELVVKSVIEYPNFELYYQPLETLSNLHLFREGMMGQGIANENTVRDLSKHVSYHMFFDRFGTDDHWDEQFSQQMLLKIKYDNFTFDKENDFINEITSYNITMNIIDDIEDIYSLTLLTRSNPLPEMLKSTIAKFVVSAIIVSSVYAFYIHFKNELHSKHKTLATLNLIGVKFKAVLKEYAKFFVLLFGASFVMSYAAIRLLGIWKPSFKPSLVSTSYAFLISLGFIIVIFGVFVFNLIKIQKRALESYKTGGLTYLKLPETTQNNLALNLSLKRFTKTFGLNLGFALSVALSISVVLVSMSALNSIKNVYHKDTLGLSFDYYIEDLDVDTYLKYREMGIDVAQVYKQTGMTFLDYSISQPVDKVTSGSVITIYDDIEPFMVLDKGEMPPHASTFTGETEWEVYERIEVLASKRLMDTNGLFVQSNPEGPVDKHYLFIKETLNSYERGLPIRGSFATLMDRGYVSYFYKKSRIQSVINENMALLPVIVNLNGVMTQENFEKEMATHDFNVTPIDKILKEFSDSNEKLNQDSVDILLLIVIAMSIQALFNISGVLVQMNHNKQKEDTFYLRVGMQTSLLKKVNILELGIRIITSILIVMVFVVSLLPVLNHQLTESFAILFLPSSYLKEILSISLIVIICLTIGFITVSKRKDITHAEN